MAERSLYLRLRLRMSSPWTRALFPIHNFVQMLNHPGKHQEPRSSPRIVHLEVFSDLSPGICHGVYSTAWGQLDRERAHGEEAVVT